MFIYDGYDWHKCYRLPAAKTINILGLMTK